MVHNSKQVPHKEELTKTGLDKLGRLSRITTLAIDASTFADSDLSFISKLHGLRNLVLPDTGITDGFLPTLKHLSEPAYLDCSSDHITDNGLKTISNIPRLESLNIRSNPDITDDGIKYLTKLKLKKICLEGKALTDKSLLQLARFAVVLGNPISRFSNMSDNFVLLGLGRDPDYLREIHCIKAHGTVVLITYKPRGLSLGLIYVRTGNGASWEDCFFHSYNSLHVAPIDYVSLHHYWYH